VQQVALLPQLKHFVPVVTFVQKHGMPAGMV